MPLRACDAPIIGCSVANSYCRYMGIVWSDTIEGGDAVERIINAATEFAAGASEPVIIATSDPAALHGRRGHVLAKALWDVMHGGKALLLVVPENMQHGVARETFFQSPLYSMECPRRANPARPIGTLQDYLFES